MGLNSKKAVAKIFALGARAVLLKPRNKQPAEKDWPNKEPTQEEVEAHVTGGGNVGVLLGAKSNGLSDVDLDSREARSLARAFLPATGLIHGRASSRASHYWYRVSGDLKKVVYKDPPAREGERGTLLEVRGDGHQTAVPPSVHPSGEQVEWEKDGEPAAVTAEELLKATAWLAIASLLVRVWVKDDRNDLALWVAGWLLRAGQDPEDVEHLIYQVALAAGDEEADQRSNVVRPTAEKLKRKEAVGGWGKLRDTIGEPRAKALWKWLPEGAADDSKAKIPPPMGVQDLFDQPEPETDFLVSGHLETSSNFLVVGYPKSLKTFFCLDLSIALASGKPFLHWLPGAKGRRVGLILMEDHPIRTRRRLWRLARSRGVRPEDLEGLIFFWFRPRLRLADKKAMAELAEYVKQYELDVLILDNWSYVNSGDSNNADEVTRQLEQLSELRSVRPQLSVGLVQHARKKGPGGGERVTDVIRNSTAFGAWFDTCWVLARKHQQGPVTVITELRDLPGHADFEIDVEDETPGDPEAGTLSTGYLRLQGRKKKDVREDLEGEIEDFIRDQPGSTQSQVVRGVGSQKARVVAALEKMEADGRVRVEKKGRGYAYFLGNKADPNAPGF